MDFDAANLVIGALNSRLRLQLVFLLSERKHYVHELVETLGESQPLISQHLRVLKEAGLVDSERRGRQVIYELTDHTVIELIARAARLGLGRGNALPPLSKA